MHKLRIPDSLWATMKQAPGIDWGLVVVRSIHNYLEELAKQQRNIEYYQQNRVSASTPAGFIAGQYWAERLASPAQLRRLKRKQHIEQLKNWGIGHGVLCSCTMADQLFAQLHSDEPVVDHYASRRFWGKLPNVNYEDICFDAEFLIAFGKGALASPSRPRSCRPTVIPGRKDR